MWEYNYTVNQNDTLCHYGVLGQRWGIRRYQNKDGTLTAAGKKRLDDYKKKEIVASDKKWDKTKAKYMKRVTKAYEKGTNALNEGKLSKAAKYDKKYIDAQKGYCYAHAMKLTERKEIAKMSYKDMNKEKAAVGQKYVEDILVTGGTLASTYFTPNRVVLIQKTNMNRYKTNLRVDTQTQANIAKIVN